MDDREYQLELEKLELEREALTLKTFEALDGERVDIKRRRIYLTSDIDEEIVDPIVAQIHLLNEMSDAPIQMIVNSPGGCDDRMYYLYDAITCSKAPIHTIGSGFVCSAASLIFVCADVRYATENCMLMTHKGKAVLSGDDDELSAQAELQKDLSDRYWKLMARHTKRSAGDWFKKSKMEGENWLNAEDMLKWGAADEIIKPVRRQFEELPKRRLKILMKEITHDWEDE